MVPLGIWGWGRSRLFDKYQMMIRREYVLRWRRHRIHLQITSVIDNSRLRNRVDALECNRALRHREIDQGQHSYTSS